MRHASIFTAQACALFAGPHAAKRMARAVGCSVKSCADYLGGRRRMSLDTAIELAGRHEQAFAALLQRVQEVRERQGTAAPNRPAIAAANPVKPEVCARSSGSAASVNAAPPA